jgi:hypothetical protein
LRDADDNFAEVPAGFQIGIGFLRLLEPEDPDNHRLDRSEIGEAHQMLKSSAVPLATIKSRLLIPLPGRIL